MVNTNKKFKIEITKTYCIDVVARTQEEAEDLACVYLDMVMLDGKDVYYQTGNTEFNSYDVTNTDDPFNQIN